MKPKMLLVIAAGGLMAAGAVPVFAQSWAQTQPVEEVEKPHLAPYQASVGVNFGFSCQNCESKFFAALPAGKRLVLEQVSVAVSVPPTGAYTCRLGPSGGPFLTLEAPRVFGNQAVISQQVRMYFDSAPLLSCTRNEASGIQWGGVAFAGGYLVDKPTP
ncbi:MAG: hypothetical protein SFV54_00490 [Bryobacteraceae bacterium]|nr:hypothetical protein [Bryobacteraceae bacterium]